MTERQEKSLHKNLQVNVHSSITLIHQEPLTNLSGSEWCSVQYAMDSAQNKKGSNLDTRGKGQTWKYGKWKKPAAKQCTLLCSYAAPQVSLQSKLNWLPGIGVQKETDYIQIQWGGFCFVEDDVNYTAVIAIKFHTITKTIKFYTLNEWILLYVNDMAAFFTTKKNCNPMTFSSNQNY